ncbi:conserved hypothetical protein [Vibrio jasicida]|uniref:AAA+ ATPase domain-containing protein n=1 Tax=Vibrio jasicida TaxID=766224 RepID=A0AAU9QKC8_9VIBR|nr:hypothetical protein [Vibrio coralliilyticus]PAW00751.1 hypothetical protein CKJ79_25200 [Vibrio coralliilyticus]CAH1583321.1 conserved hypothetical protein [Vibrio jasicida]CAH1596377.1 conserved hypothetical protein [Vibrio jasicida]
MEKVRITVEGYKVTHHANQVIPHVRVVDSALAIKRIESAMGDLVLQGKPKFICIEGHSGSGKTSLSLALTSNGMNVKCINTIEELEKAENLEKQRMSKTSIAHLLVDQSVTYVIDELGIADADCAPILKSHLEQGGVLVALLQDKRDLTFDIGIEPVWFRLNGTPGTLDLVNL